MKAPPLCASPPVGAGINDEHELKRLKKSQIDEAINSDRLQPSEGMRLLDDYERGLREYTYLGI